METHSRSENLKLRDYLPTRRIRKPCTISITAAIEEESAVTNDTLPTMQGAAAEVAQLT